MGPSQPQCVRTRQHLGQLYGPLITCHPQKEFCGYRVGKVDQERLRIALPPSHNKTAEATCRCSPKLRRDV